MARFGIDDLHVTVVADAAHKPSEAPAEDRLAMAELAFAELDATVELETHRYTVDALEAAGYDDPIFLIGADELAALPDLEGPGAGARAGAARGRHASGLRAGDRLATHPDLRAGAPSGFLVRDPPSRAIAASRSTASSRRPSPGTSRSTGFTGRG